MNRYYKILEILQNADAILIGAGSGLSTSAGIHYDTTHFQEQFPELFRQYGMTDMYTSSFYNFATEEEKWSYWTKHIAYVYHIDAKPAYQSLYALVKSKPHFVITTNVDGQFQKAGFEASHLFEVQGNLSQMQCSIGCHDMVYDTLELVSKMLVYRQDIKIPSTLVPYCPICQNPMEVHLRKDNTFVEDASWKQHNKAYKEFIAKYQNKHLLLLEFGAGFNTPGIIRYPFESLTLAIKNSFLIRVNQDFPFLPEELQGRSFAFEEDCAYFINSLYKLVL